ncbi:Hypothetical Protein FCC1311_081972 [Hondaea fermentalgiana]|uniref:PDZ domain-containing protein n=1 Tax=Hondaea fermentalgiana TaxID=2315210 RepID=A0A2R5GM50_9STRA|nr:Hypothetical Protein FCC1311_081972 [Hondaea fermentalgiana]|eukprot:GBG31972.1 Hypothetical Protein FCC1311_081972 [Hondaea fermentalgiana]
MPPPPGWRACGPFVLDKGGDGGEENTNFDTNIARDIKIEGWAYNTSFAGLDSDFARGTCRYDERARSLYRRRRWVRELERTPENATDEPTRESAQSAQNAAKAPLCQGWLGVKLASKKRVGRSEWKSFYCVLWSSQTNATDPTHGAGSREGLSEASLEDPQLDTEAITLGSGSAESLDTDNTFANASESQTTPASFSLVESEAKSSGSPSAATDMSAFPMLPPLDLNALRLRRFQTDRASPYSFRSNEDASFEDRQSVELRSESRGDDLDQDAESMSSGTTSPLHGAEGRIIGSMYGSLRAHRFDALSTMDPGGLAATDASKASLSESYNDLAFQSRAPMAKTTRSVYFMRQASGLGLCIGQDAATGHTVLSKVDVHAQFRDGGETPCIGDRILSVGDYAVQRPEDVIAAIQVIPEGVWVRVRLQGPIGVNPMSEEDKTQEIFKLFAQEIASLFGLTSGYDAANNESEGVTRTYAEIQARLCEALNVSVTMSNTAVWRRWFRVKLDRFFAETQDAYEVVGVDMTSMSAVVRVRQESQ